MIHGFHYEDFVKSIHQIALKLFASQVESSYGVPFLSLGSSDKRDALMDCVEKFFKLILIPRANHLALLSWPKLYLILTIKNLESIQPPWSRDTVINNLRNIFEQRGKRYSELISSKRRGRNQKKQLKRKEDEEKMGLIGEQELYWSFKMVNGFVYEKGISPTFLPVSDVHTFFDIISDTKLSQFSSWWRDEVRGLFEELSQVRKNLLVFFCVIGLYF